MAEKSNIGWTQATWNPFYGCTKVSPGCAHCYMFRDMKRYGRDPETVTRSKTTFSDPLKWRDSRLIFTCSWSDWFHADADAWRPEAWDIIRRTPHHTYQVLTKRPERIADHLPADWGNGWPNVWLGTSVENQRWTPRIAKLLQVPAHVHFISGEPLLGSVILVAWCPSCQRPLLGSSSPTCGTCHGATTRLDWVIAGGESGVDHRPMQLDWARSLRDQCQAAGIPFFLKQLGGHPDARAHEKALLDGRTHTDMPKVYRGAEVAATG